jgi:hypothetical protein
MDQQSSFLDMSKGRPAFVLPKTPDTSQIAEVRRISLDAFDAGIGPQGRAFEAFVMESDSTDLGVILVPEEWVLVGLSQAETEEDFQTALKVVSATRAITIIRDSVRAKFLREPGVYTIAFSMLNHQGERVENYEELLFPLMRLGTDEITIGKNGEILMLVEVADLNDTTAENIRQRAPIARRE